MSESGISGANPDHPLQCQLCYQRFSLKESLLNHMLVKHQNQNMSEPSMSSVTKYKYWQCEICDCSFAIKRNLQRHLDLKHRKTNKSCQKPEKCMQCDQCGQRFARKRNLQKHIVLNRHVKSISQRKYLQCEHCDRRFVRNKHLQRHVAMKHQTTSMPQSSFSPEIIDKYIQCEHCGQRFVLRTNLEKHIVLRHQNTNLSQSDTSSYKIERPFQCDLCGQRFRGKWGLQFHVVRHLNKQTFKCGKCSFTGYSVCRVQAHWKLMHSGPPNISNIEISCDLCGKKLNTEQALREHVARRHRNLLQCHLCEDKGIYLTMVDLETHFLAAHGKRAWRRHQHVKCKQAKRKVYNLSRDPETSQFTCYVCKTMYSLEKYWIFNHIIHKHLKILRFKCEFCIYQTDDKSFFETHKLRCHKYRINKPFVHLSKNQRVETSMETATSEVKSEPLEMNTEIELPDLILGSNEVEIKSEDTKVWKDGSAECGCGTCQELSLDEHETTRQHVRALHGASKCRFQCIVCGYGSSDLLPLKQHIGTQHLVTEHSNTHENKCQLCSTVLNSIKALQVHIRDKHYSEFACSECGQNFTSLSMVKNHFVRFHGLKKYDHYLVDRILGIESRIQHTDLPIRCHICKKRVFLIQNPAVRHILHDHFLITKLACTLCLYTCRNLCTMRNHMWQKHFPEEDRGAIQEGPFGFWKPEFVPEPEVSKIPPPKVSKKKAHKTVAITISELTVFQNSTAAKIRIESLLSKSKKANMVQRSSVEIVAANRIEDLNENHSDGNEFQDSPLEIVAEATVEELDDIPKRVNISFKIPCPMCENQAFETIKALRGHFSTNHEQEAWNEHQETIQDELDREVTNLVRNPRTRLLECFLCLSSMQERDALYKHIKHDHLLLNELFKCTYCSVVCGSIQDRKDHVMSSHCTPAPISRFQKSIEKNSTGTSTKSFSKSVVPSTFATQGSQNTNKTASSSLIPSSSSSASHTEVLRNPKLFQTYLCEICHTYFTHEFIIETHWYMKHGETEPRYSRVAPPVRKMYGIVNDMTNFPCRFCNVYYFKSRGNHNSHVAARHPKIYVCSECEFETVCLEALQIHRKVKHTTVPRATEIVSSETVIASQSSPIAPNIEAEFPRRETEIVVIEPLESEPSITAHAENQETNLHGLVEEGIEVENLKNKEQALHHDSENVNRENLPSDLVELATLNTAVLALELTECSSSGNLIANPNHEINQVIPKPPSVPSEVSTKEDPDIVENNFFNDFQLVESFAEENVNTTPTLDMNHEVLDLVIKDEPLISIAPEENSAEDAFVSSSVPDSELPEFTNQEGSTFVLVDHVHGKPVDPTTHELPAPLTRSESEVQADEEAMVQEALLNIRNVPRDPRLGYQCFICGKYLKSDKQKFSSHVVEYHMRIEKFECRYCSAKFFSEEWAVVHHDKEHAGLPPGYVRRFATVDSADLLYGEEGGGKSPQTDMGTGVSEPRGKWVAGLGWGDGSVGKSKGRVVKRKEGTGGTGRGKKSRADSPNPHPRAERNRDSGRESRPDHNPILLVSSPPSRLTAAPRASVTSGCAPDLLAGSGAQGRRVTSRPYPDSLPPVPGGCLPCSVQL